MFLWWYEKGWAVFAQKVRESILGLADFFSMSSLVRTLFKPYRQISAETASGSASLELKFHMFIDRMVSRLVGFSTRLILLITGGILIILGGLLSLVILILWPIVPFLPFVGLVLTFLGATL